VGDREGERERGRRLNKREVDKASCNNILQCSTSQYSTVQHNATET
jgi:hypothetical protein